ncbi:MAG: TM2 domain-containing protein [Chloroflexi bacterium]|nr:TM2 domain-containing protein [Chloroflexota bacterium]
MEKSKIVAALLAFFLGAVGIHKFYLGKTTAGLIHILLGIGGYILLFIGMFAGVAGIMSGSGSIGGLGLFVLIIGLLAVVVNGLICLVETVLYLIKSDEEFNRIYVRTNKSWF